MKKTNWLLLKLAFIFMGLLTIYGFNLQSISAEIPGGCNTQQACGGFWECNCGDSDCGGCYKPNGQGGCGTCASGG